MPATDDVQMRGKSAFPDTSWGLVLAAGDEQRGRDAFGLLCRRYWTPIYASLRRQGFSPAEAEDRVQGFFLHVIEQGTVTYADRSRGRFRSFMLGALRRFLANRDEHERALKRGGGRRFIALDAPEMEALMWTSGDDTLSLDLQFDRQWARMLLVNALAVLRDEHERTGQAQWFESLQTCLDPGAVTPSYGKLAITLDCSEGAVKTAVHRLRRRFGETLRREVACTVAAERDVDEELAYLRDILATEVPRP